jgi:manganese transport protein
MLAITSKKDLMGDFVNRPFTKFLGAAIAVMIIGLNAVLLILTFSGKV